VVIAVEEPAWLRAWRERGPQPLAQPRTSARQGGGRRAAASAAVAEAARPSRPKGNSLGFIEPEQWPYDGGKRRESVLDLEYFPPRVVRKVGWRNCMCCGKPFWSEDTTRLRLCDGDTGCRDQTPVRYRKAATD
jgi:hypothetical protein